MINIRVQAKPPHDAQQILDESCQVLKRVCAHIKTTYSDALLAYDEGVIRSNTRMDVDQSGDEEGAQDESSDDESDSDSDSDSQESG